MSDYDGAVCARCGTGWFTLEPAPDDEGPVVAVCMDRRGRITGHTGHLCCLDCGERWDETRLLRLI